MIVLWSRKKYMQLRYIMAQKRVARANGHLHRRLGKYVRATKKYRDKHPYKG